jgi:hypothetical protein
MSFMMAAMFSGMAVGPLLASWVLKVSQWMELFYFDIMQYLMTDVIKSNTPSITCRKPNPLLAYL